MEFASRPCNCELPMPLFVVVSSVIVPAGGGAFLPGVMKNHVARNTSDAAGVGVGEGTGLGAGVGVGDGAGVGLGIGVGVGVPGVLLETEPQPARKMNNPESKIRMTLRK